MTKNQCDACNAMCRIEGWKECWGLCTCECHNVKSSCCNSDLVNFNKEYNACFVCGKLHPKTKLP